MVNSIAIRNLSTQPLHITYVNRYADPDAKKSSLNISMMKRNITALVSDETKVTAIPDNATPDAQQSLDILVPPFDTGRFDIERTDKDVCRVLFETDGRLFNVDLYNVEGHKPQIRGGDAGKQLYAVWNVQQGHVSVMSEAQLGR